IESHKIDPNLADQDCNIAVCGAASTGKCSLVNSIRGMANEDPAAAATGRQETTKSRITYPGDTKTIAGGRVVWHNLPGSGTNSASSSTYYNEHRLSIFDRVVLVLIDIATYPLIDVAKRCRTNDQKVIVVRSHSDMGLHAIRKEVRGKGKGRKEDLKGKLREEERASTPPCLFSVLF
ncbi:hypothetical protein K458DRAFT_292695, partial [Lentithecium fluviatile CBS 122367]